MVSFPCRTHQQKAILQIQRCFLRSFEYWFWAKCLKECLMSQLAPIRNKGSNSVMAPNDAESVESHLPESNWRPALYEGAALPTELRWRTDKSLVQSKIGSGLNHLHAIRQTRFSLAMAASSIGESLPIALRPRTSRKVVTGLSSHSG